jgi:hypothetical protein
MSDVKESMVRDTPSLDLSEQEAHKDKGPAASEFTYELRTHAC